MRLSGWILALPVVGSLAGCGPTAENPVPFLEPTHNELRIEVLPADIGVSIKVENQAQKRLAIINVLEPEYDVVRLYFVGEDGKPRGLALSVDWCAFRSHIQWLEPGASITRRVATEGIPSGRYRIQAVYEVTGDSFFVEPWLKDMLTDRGPAFQETKRQMQALWFGKAVSEVTAVTIKNPGQHVPGKAR